MRIVHLVTSGDVAGGQLVALQLARAARARGDDVAFVSPTDGPFLDLARAEGVRSFRIRRARRCGLRGALALSRLLRRERADVLHTHTHLAASVLGRLAARGAGAAVVSHLHIENHFRARALPRAVSRTLDNATVTRLVEEGGIVAPTGKPGSVLMFHGNLVHASAPNITPYPRRIVYAVLPRHRAAILLPLQTRAGTGRGLAHRGVRPKSRTGQVVC